MPDSLKDTSKDFVDKEELIDEVESLERKCQRSSDKLRVQRASKRHHDRVTNAVSELLAAINAKLITRQFKPARKTKYSEDGGALIVHVSDAHFNELVDMESNKYDFNVASARLYKLARRVQRQVEVTGVRKVIIALTGDLLNSDRREDEKLCKATNRAAACIIAVELLSLFISDISNFSNVTVASVMGNESRITKDMSFQDEGALDSYDFLVHHMLSKLFANNNVVDFVGGMGLEFIISVDTEAGERNVLMGHGHNYGKMNDAQIAKISDKWTKKGTVLHYIICGHLHSTMITDFLARGASLVGNNEYADRGLNLAGRASQNLISINSDGSIDSLRIDLQDTDGSMYNIKDDLEAYNAKSAEKARPITTIHKVVI